MILTIIRELGIVNSYYIKTIAALHSRAFPSFFLTQLGEGFLSTLYKGYLEDQDSGIIVAEVKGKLVGFLAYSNDYPKFFKFLIKNHVIKFALYSIGAVIKHPSFIKRLLGALNKSEAVIKNEKYVEIASICVDPEIENKGVGTELIQYLKAIVDFNEYSYINLETDAVENNKVNDFYLRNGFVLARVFTTPEGRKMNEYRFKGQN